MLHHQLQLRRQSQRDISFVLPTPWIKTTLLFTDKSSSISIFFFIIPIRENVQWRQLNKWFLPTISNKKLKYRTQSYLNYTLLYTHINLKVIKYVLILYKGYSTWEKSVVFLRIYNTYRVIIIIMHWYIWIKYPELLKDHDDKIDFGLSNAKFKLIFS